MASVIDPWIWPGIETEIRQVLKSISGDHTSSPINSNLKFEDDDSNLRIRSSLVGKRVQLIKFETFKDPIHVVISDKATSIRATIASQAAKAFSKKSGRDITQASGGVIQILDFEVVATNLSRVESRVTLLIKDFRHLGSDGEGTFGDPKPIEHHDRSRGVLHEVHLYRERRPMPNSLQQVKLHSGDELSDDPKDIDPRFDSGSSEVEIGLATQLPLPKISKKSQLNLSASASTREKVSEVITSEKGNGPHVLHSIKLHSGSSGCHSPKNENLEECNEIQPKAQAITKAVQGQPGLRNTNAGLLALLQQKKGSNKSLAPALQFGTTEYNRIDPIPVTASAPIGPNNGEGTAADNTSKAAIILSPPLADSSDAARPDKEDPEPECEVYVPLNEVSQIVAPEENGNKHSLPEFSTHANESLPPASDAQENEVDASEATDKRVIKIVAAKTGLGEFLDPWHGLNRIRRRDITIPGNQQRLLEEETSWYPPQPGKRVPIANIPLDVLQSLTAQIDLPEDSLLRHKYSKRKRPSTDEESERNDSLESVSVSGSGDSNSESGDTPTASDWPPTPPVKPSGNKLPPDSSAPSPVRPNAIDTSNPSRQSQRSTENSTPRKDEKSETISDTPFFEQEDENHALVDSAASCSLDVDSTYEAPVSMKLPEIIAGIESSRNSSTNLRGEKSSTLHSPVFESHQHHEIITFSSDSEMEMTLPNALSSSGNEIRIHDPQLMLPLTFSEKPTLLVDRTPYRDPHIHQRVYNRRNSKSTLNELGGRAYDGFNDDAKAVYVVPGTYNTNVDNLPNGQASNLVHQSEHANENVHQLTIPHSSMNELLKSEPKLDSPMGTSKEGNIKRKSEDITTLSPNITKRRKRVRIPGFDFKQQSQDPTEIGRQLRREFLANLRMEAIKSGTMKDMSNDAATQSDDNAESVDEETDCNRQIIESIEIPEEVVTSPDHDSVLGFGDISGEDQVPQFSPELPATLPPRPEDVILFQRFKDAYPAYKADKKHFVAMCRKIHLLQFEGRMEHKALWDDFIVRNHLEYRHYVYQCVEQAENPMPYEHFYHNEIEDPKYIKRIVTPKNFSEVMAIIAEQNLHTAPSRSPLELQNSPKSPTQENRSHSVVQISTPRSKDNNNLPKPTTELTSSPVIDLTGEAEAGQTRSLKTPPVGLGIKLQRSFPWLRLGVPSTVFTPTRSAKIDNIQNGSSVGPSPSGSERMRVMPNTKCESRADTRTQDHLSRSFRQQNTVDKHSPSNSKSDMPEPNVPMRPASSATKGPNRRDYLTSISPLITAKDGPSKVKPSKVKENAAMSPLARANLLSANQTANKKTNSERPKDWWRDPNNPFKEFVRADASIRAGNGNAFNSQTNIKEVDKGKGVQRGVRIRDGIVIAERKKLDPLSWKL